MSLWYWLLSQELHTLLAHEGLMSLEMADPSAASVSLQNSAV
jgi:hypothetical protein